MGWFSGKTKNRRLKVEDGLQTKAERRQTRALQWRIASTALAVASVALIVLLLVSRGGDWLMRRLVYDNPAFAIGAIDIQTDGVLPLEQLRQWSGVKPGDNLLAADLLQIKRHLELAPLIREVSVERILPGTLKIRVMEREPMVQAHSIVRNPGNGDIDVAVYYLDDEGYVMRPLDDGLRSLSAYANENYAVLTGMGRSDLCPGRKAESPQVFAALRLLETFEQSPMFGVVDLTRIDVSTPEVLVATTAQGGEITLALDRFDTQLRRWRAVHDYTLKQGRRIARLDLSVTNNLPVVLMETNQVLLDKPKPIKTSHTRKKHV